MVMITTHGDNNVHGDDDDDNDDDDDDDDDRWAYLSQSFKSVENEFHPSEI